MGRILIWLAGVILLVSPAWADDDAPRLSFGSDAARTMTIAWNTHADGPQFAEVRLIDGDWARHEATRRPWEAMERVIHETALVDLRPNTPYEYRVGDGQQWSAVHSFVTGPIDPCQPFSFVALGDDRSQDEFGPSLNWAPILAESMNEDPAFALNGGDLVMTGSEAVQWYNWLHHTGPLLTQVPHMPTIGNHDDDHVDGEDANYNRVFALPRNDVTETEDFYYFTYGDLIVVILSTATYTGQGLAEQADWLDRVLTENPKRWKIVEMHHPVYTSDLFGLMHEPNEVGQNAALVPIFDRHHVDLVLQSHNHWYQRFNPSFGGAGGDDAVPVDSAAEGTVYLTTGGAGAFTVDFGDLGDLALGADCLGTAGCALLRGEHHYVLFEMEPNRLLGTVQATAAQNFGMEEGNREIMDQFEIVKEGEERIDCANRPPPDAGPPPPLDAGVPPLVDAAPPAEKDAEPIVPVVDATPPPLPVDAGAPDVDPNRPLRPADATVPPGRRTPGPGANAALTTLPPSATINRATAAPIPPRPTTPSVLRCSPEPRR